MQIYRGRRVEDGQPVEVVVEDEFIYEVRACSHDDVAWISPGFIDLQVNGYGGDDVNAPAVDAATIIRLSRKVLATGVTTFLPTIITSSEESISLALRAVQQARGLDPVVAAMIPYVHLEGPYISPVDGARGAHPREHVRSPSLEEFERWQQVSGGLVGLVTISPHWEEAEKYIASVTSSGVHVAIGHTDASPEKIRKGIEAGARLSTHLGNGIADMIPRHGNPVWTQLADDRLNASFIADGHHLPADTLTAMMRAKGVGRSILVSDAVALAGMPPGSYETPVGGAVVLEESGRLSLKGTEFLAGAAVPLKDGIARAMAMTGVSLRDAVRMATENPGRFTGDRGRLQVGARSDLVRFAFNKQGTGLQIESVVLAGVEYN